MEGERFSTCSTSGVVIYRTRFGFVGGGEEAGKYDA
jgi:hypothetical protein